MISDLQPGFKFSQYQLLEQIGVGGQGVVWSAEDMQRQDVVAIKFNDAAEDGQEAVDDAVLEQELKKLATLRHVYVLPIYDHGLTAKMRYLVSPYLCGGSLAELISRTPMQVTDGLQVASQIASALDFLHDNYIIHRDLKPANVLMDLNQHTYLSDFGLARTISATTQAMHTGRGTPPYAPPEQHKQLAITAKSDLYSFGIMLYEMFTGQLPWNGEKILGMQQLYSKIELPDPAEVNQQLPPQLKDIFRQLTSADPTLRPSSAGEAIARVMHAFQLEGPSIVSSLDPTANEVLSSQDAQILLDQKLIDWKTKNKQTWLSPTRFAMVHLEQRRNPPRVYDGSLAQFLLYHSTVYAYQDGYWWGNTSDPRDQAAAALALLERRNDVIASRVLGRVFENQKVLSLFRARAEQLCPLLLELVIKSRSPALTAQLISLLQMILPPGREWNDRMISPSSAAFLGKIALQENELGEQALELIGQVRSRAAVEFLVKNADRRELSFLLSKIRNRAGSLPGFVSGGIRAQLFLEWINQQLTAQPVRLVGGYITALIGCTLGFAAQIYLTIRIASFFSSERISLSLERGLIMGFVFSLGIFAARLIVERFERVAFPMRFTLAAAVGTLCTTAAFFLLDVLFLNAAPSGLLMPAGCFVIACSFSLGPRVKSRILKMMISSAAIFIAILGTWWVHVTLSASVIALTPLFQYDAQWPLIQISLTALCVAVSIGLLGNLARLDLHEG